MNAKQESVKEQYKAFTDSKSIGDIFELMKTTGYKYSPTNTMMILSQVAVRDDDERGKFCNVMKNYNLWKKEGKQVLKGSKGYYVYFPYIKKEIVEDNNGEEKEKKRLLFGIGSTFDISQTDGYDQYLAEQKELDEKVYGGRKIEWDYAVSMLDKIGIKYEIDKDDTKHRGYYQPAKGKTQTLFGEMETVNAEEKIHIGAEGDGDTIVHEIGHAKTYSTDENYATNELTAEIFRCHVCNALDIEFNYTYSKIWSSRLTEVMEFSKFNKLWKSIGDKVKELIEVKQSKVA